MSFTSNIIAQNTTQMSLEEAIALVRQNADQDWYKAALEAVRSLCTTQREFSTDNVWQKLDALDLSTKEPRALGAIMREAASKGWCRPSGRYVKSSRPECHRRPVAVWITGQEDS